MPFITRVKRQKRSRDRKENGKFKNSTNRRSRVGLSTPFYTFPANEKSLCNFCSYKETLKARPWRTPRVNLSRNKPVQNGVSSKQVSVMKIRKICVSGKALREEVVAERGSGELAGTSKVYLDSCNSEFESIKCCSSLSTSVKKGL